MPVLNNQQVRGSTSSSRPKQRKEEKKPDLLCRVKYNNTVPDVPFDPKFLVYPFDANRFITYKPTTLEKNHKWELLTDNDLGVKIDLINPDTYAVDFVSSTRPDPTDEKLLEDESSQSQQDAKRSKQHSKVVPWMRKTEYISSEFNRFGTQTERQETKIGHNIKRVLKEESLYKDRESQIQAINKTFEDVSVPVLEHYSKPGVVAKEELSIFPDYDLWQFPFAQVIFDADPSPVGMPLSSAMLNAELKAENEKKMSQAVIRGMMDESGEQFVAYFLPTDETTVKREEDIITGLDYRPDETYDYKLAREYNWTVKNKASKGYEENYFFVFRPDGVFYNELETRVRLSRRRAKEGQPKVVNSRLMVRHREQNENEIDAQRARSNHLQAVQEEEEFVAEETHEDETAENTTMLEDEDAVRQSPDDEDKAKNISDAVSVDEKSDHNASADELSDKDSDES